MFDVLTQYDPGHLLLRQSYEEVINDQMDQARLRKALIRIHKEGPIRKTYVFRLSASRSVDSMRGKMSSERMADRIRRMVEENGG